MEVMNIKKYAKYEMWWGSWGHYISSSVPWGNFNAYILGCLGSIMSWTQKFQDRNILSHI